MSTTTAARPAAARPGKVTGRAVRSTAPVARGRRRTRMALLSLITLGVVAGGVWGMLAPRDAAGHGAGHDVLASVELPDGTLRVEGLVDRQVGHVMPGMAVAKDVPAGMRRFGVDITLGATQGRTLDYSRRDFTVSGPGVKPVVPVDGQIDRGALTPGRAISGSLSFDVPEDTVSVSLRYRDADVVALPDLPPLVAPGGHGAAEPAPAQGGHGADGHQDAPAGPAEHVDAPGAPAHGH